MRHVATATSTSQKMSFFVLSFILDSTFRFQSGSSQLGENNNRLLHRVSALNHLNQATDQRILPDGMSRTVASPSLHCPPARSWAARDPLEYLRDHLLFLP